MTRTALIFGLIAISPFTVAQEMKSVASLLEEGKDPNKLKSASTALVWQAIGDSRDTRRLVNSPYSLADYHCVKSQPRFYLPARAGSRIKQY